MPRFEKKKSLRSKEASRLKRLREKLGWTQQRLAEEWLVSDGAVGHWEDGVRTIPGPVLKLIEIYEGQLRRKK